MWESKNNYFDEGIIDKLKQPSTSWSEYQANLVAQHASAITPITTSTKQTFDNYQAQHQAFVTHALRQIQNIEQQKIAIDQQLKAPPPPPPQLVSLFYLLYIFYIYVYITYSIKFVLFYRINRICLCHLVIPVLQLQ